MIDIDDAVGRDVINKFMCSDFCICPGTPNSAHYKAYEAEEAELIASGRSFKDGFDSTVIQFDRFGTEGSPLIWAFDPETGLKDDFLVKLQSNSLLECLDNMYITLTNFKDKAVEDAITDLKA